MKIRIFWFFWIIVVFIFTFLVPPFQKPDEPVHFLRAMTLAEGQLFCRSTSDYRYFSLTQSVYEFPEAMQTSAIIMKPDGKFPIGLYKQRFPFRSDTSIIDKFRYCQLPFVSYIPFSLSAVISFPFDNLLTTFFSMRAMGAMLFICFSFIGYILIPKRYKLLFLFILANPMIIHQATSVSYDALFYDLLIFVVSLWLRCMDEKKLDGKSLSVLILFLMLLCMVKPGYYALAGIILPILIKISFKKHIVLIAVLCFFCTTITAIFLPNITSTFSNYFLTTNTTQIYVVTHDPWYFISVAVHTMMQSQERLTTGMIGQFGWIDYTLPLWAIILYVFIGGMISYDYIGRQTKSMKAWVIIYVGTLCMSTIILICYLFYRTSTPAAYHIVEGIQGRYFLPLVPFVLIIFLESMVWMKIRKLMPVVYVFLGMVAVAILSFIIYVRYYDYSKNFSNPDQLVKEVVEKKVDITSLAPIEIASHVSFLYEIAYPGYKIGGMQMIAGNELDADIPYRFSIKDKDCKKILFQGYMNELLDIKLAHLKGKDDVVITQHIPITPIHQPTVCLELEPVVTPSYAVYLKLLGEHDKPVVRFLYIAK